MASNSGGTRGLLVVGGVLVAVAITINASQNDVSSHPDAAETSGARGTTEREEGTSAPIAGQAGYGFVEHASDTDFRQKVLAADGPVLVDFYADWCGPCRTIAPLLDELAREEPGVKIVKVDVDDSPTIAAHFAIHSIPALIVFREGRPVNRKTGALSKSQLRGMLGL